MDWPAHILKRSFYRDTPPQVARKLLGKYLVRRLGKKYLVGKIVEVEAYLPEGDSAAHSFIGPTARNKSLYKDAGHAYVHAMRQYFLLDITTGQVGIPGSVLIRALLPQEGIEMYEDIANGPGKLCRALEIDKKFDGVDITDPVNNLFIAKIEKDVSPHSIHISKRIGISKATEELLRFSIK